MADLLTAIRAEIDARLRELAPAIAEYEQLSSVAEALAEEGRGASRPTKRAASQAPASRPSASASASAGASAKTTAPRKGGRRARKREQPALDPTAQAILAALEHGSHTVAELVLVTALAAGDIRDSLRQLRKRKAIVKTDRDGRSAYALPAPAA